MESLISATDVSIAFRADRRYHGSLKGRAIGLARRREPAPLTWAVRDATFEVSRGEFLAIVGPNGAGKTTLLRALARILRPTRGRVVVRGLVAPIIELGAGFSQDLTGRENVEMFSTLLRVDRRTARANAQDIAEWAGLQDFIDSPLRTYSTGMRGRLAFGVATSTQPDILLLDEVLAVGDESFGRKAVARMDEIRDRGTTIVLVSHQLERIRAVATQALWMDRGRIVQAGAPDEVLSAYTAQAAFQRRVRRS